MSRLRVAVDIDEVLADQAAAFVQYSNQQWGLGLDVSGYTEQWSHVWGVDSEEVLVRRDKMFKDGVYQRLLPVDGAVDVLRHLAQRFDLCVVTSRYIELQRDTRVWLEAHYPDIFSEQAIHFSGIWDSVGNMTHTLTKAETLRRLGVDFLIDDQLKHCIGASEIGVRSVLFGGYAWNQGGYDRDTITRCLNWGAVREYFDDVA